MFVALVEVNGNKLGVSTIGQDADGISLLVSWISIMLITLNLAFLAGKADSIRKKIFMKVFKHKKTEKRHYVVQGLTKRDT